MAEIVAEHGVERVDQFAARRHEAYAAGGIRAPGCSTAGRPLAQSRRANPAESQRDAENARTRIQERQVEPVEIVVLDDIRIGNLHARHEAADEVGFGGIGSSRASSTSVAPDGSRTAIMKIRLLSGSSPVVSRSNCMRRS